MQSQIEVINWQGLKAIPVRIPLETQGKPNLLTASCLNREDCSLLHVHFVYTKLLHFKVVNTNQLVDLLLLFLKAVENKLISLAV